MAAGDFVCATVQFDMDEPVAANETVTLDVFHQNGGHTSIVTVIGNGSWAGGDDDAIGRQAGGQIGGEGNTGAEQYQNGTGIVGFSGKVARFRMWDSLVNMSASQLSVTQTNMTNGCEVMVMREYIARDACGNFDRRETVDTFTIQPNTLTVEPLRALELNCIASLDQIPSPSDLLVSASSDCSIARIEWCGDFPVDSSALDDDIVIQAEDMQLSGRFEIIADATAVGGSYITCTNVNPGVSSPGDFSSTNIARITLNIRRAGIYRIVGRVQADPTSPVPGHNAGNNDSFFVSVDGETPFIWDSARGTATSWADDPISERGGLDPVLWHLDAGPHTIYFLMREDGTRLDQFAVQLIAADDINESFCQTLLDRCYLVTDLCGTQLTVTQQISYILDSAPPRITGVAPYEDYGCTTGMPRTIAESLAQLSATDDGSYLTTNLVMEMIMEEDCEVIVTRTWRVQDCCGKWDQKDEAFRFQNQPGGIVFTRTVPDLDLGCINDVNQVPPPVPELLKATANGGTACNQITLAPVQDHYIRSGNEANNVQPQSTSGTLFIKGNGANTTRKSYIQFDTGLLPSDLSLLSRARLKFTVQSNGANRDLNVHVLQDTADSPWNDATLTWNNAPANADGNAGTPDAGTFVTVATLPAPSANSSHDVDVLSGLQSSQNGVVNVVLSDVPGGSGAPSMVINGSENPVMTLRPSLELEWCNPAQVNCSEVTLDLSEHRTIRNDGDGQETELRVRANGGPGPGDDKMKSYLQFDLGSLGMDLSRLTSARLDMSLLGNTSGREVRFNVLKGGTPGEDWTRAGLTWNNAPANDLLSGSGLDYNQAEPFASVILPNGIEYSPFPLSASMGIDDNCATGSGCHDNGLTATIIYTPSAADIAAGPPVVIYEDGGNANGQTLCLVNGRVQFIMKMGSAAGDCPPNPNATGNYWLNNGTLGGATAGVNEHLVGLEHPLNLVAGTQYEMQLQLDSVNGTVQLTVDGTTVSISGPGANNLNWSGNDTIGISQRNGDSGGFSTTGGCYYDFNSTASASGANSVGLWNFLGDIPPISLDVTEQVFENANLSPDGLLTFILTEQPPVEDNGVAAMFFGEPGDPLAPQLTLQFCDNPCPVDVRLGAQSNLIINGGFEFPAPGNTPRTDMAHGLAMDFNPPDGILAWTTSGADNQAAVGSQAYLGRFRGMLHSHPAGQVSTDQTQDTGFPMQMGDRYQLCFQQRGFGNWEFGQDQIRVRAFYDAGAGPVDVFNQLVDTYDEWTHDCFEFEINDLAAAGQSIQVQFAAAQQSETAGQIEWASLDEVSLIRVGGPQQGITPYGDTVLSNSLDGCTTYLQRTFIAEHDCGLVAVHTQRISYSLNIPVAFTNVPDGGYLGCLPTNTIPPVDIEALGSDLPLRDPMEAILPIMEWNGDSYVGGVWSPDITLGRTMAAVGSPTTLPITDAKAQALVGNAQAVRLSANGNFRYGGQGWGTPAGDADSLVSADNGSIQVCFSPDHFPTLVPELIWEDGGITDGTALLLDGYNLLLVMHRGGGTPTVLSYDLRKLGLRAGTDYLCAIASFDKSVTSTETATLTLVNSAGLQDQVSIPFANNASWAGTNDGGLGTYAGDVAGTAPNFVFRGMDVFEFKGTVARFSVYDQVAPPLGISIVSSEGIHSSNACEIVYRRTYTVENCCGIGDEAVVEYTWTPPTAAPVILGQAFVDLGCVNASNNVPLPNPGQFEIVHACEADVRLMAVSSTQQLDLCTYQVEHQYVAVDTCNQTGTFNQVIRFQVQLVPEIVQTEPSTNFGCQTNGFFPPTNLNLLVMNNVFTQAPFSVVEDCAADFNGSLSNLVAVPTGTGNPVDPEFEWLAQDLVLGAMVNDAEWAPRLVGDDTLNISGGVPAYWLAAGGPVVTAIGDANQATLVGSDRAIILDGVNDELFRDLTLETEGNPRFDQNPSAYRICFSPANLAGPNNQAILEMGGNGDGNILELDGSILNYHIKNGSATDFVSVDLTSLITTPDSDFVCATVSWDPPNNRFALTVENAAGEFIIDENTDLVYADIMGGNENSIGHEQGNTALPGDPTPAFFAGAIASLSYYNGYAIGTTLDDQACNYDLDAGCGALVLANSGGAVTNAGRYETVIDTCNDLIEWTSIDFEAAVPANGGIDYVITNSNGTVVASGPIPNGASSIDLSTAGLTRSDTRLWLRIDFATTGDDTCESPMLQRFQANFVCDNSDVLSITNRPIQVVDCVATMVREYRAETCCGNFDRREVTFTWTVIPELEVTPLSNLYIGCIDHTNQIPVPSALLIQASSECAWVEIEWLGDTNWTDAVCTDSLQRVYSITDVCGSNIVVTQDISWILRTEPEILTVEQGIHWGCREYGWLPPTNLTEFTTTNAISTNITNEITVTGCTAFVRRIFRIEGCCGNFDRWDVEHTYTVRPTGPFVEALADKFVGCVDHRNQVPQPNITLIEATSSCAVVDIDFLHETNEVFGVCTDSVDRVYEVTDLCGQSTRITQTVSWILNDTDPAILAVETGEFWGCQTNGWQVPPTNVFAATNYVGPIVTSEVYIVDLDGCIGTLRRTYTVTDCCTDQASATVVHTWRILQNAPVISGPTNIALGCLPDEGQIPLPNAGALTVTADCGADLVLSSISPTAVVGCVRSFTRTWIATDACGQTGTLVQTFNYSLDEQDPKFGFPLPGGDLGCTNAPGWFLPSMLSDSNAIFNALIDNCTTQVMFLGETQTQNGCQVTVTRSWMAMDACQNTEVAQNSYTYTVPPSAGPDISGPTNLQIGCVASRDEIPPPSVGQLTIAIECELVDVRHWSNSAHQIVGGPETCNWTYASVFRAEDACGAVSFFTQQVVYTIETGARIVGTPAFIDYECTERAPTPPSPLDVITDPPGLLVQVFDDVTIPNGDCSLTRTVTFLVEDCCGNFDRRSASIRWIPTPDNPELTGPLNINLGCIPDAGQVPVPNPADFMAISPCAHTAKFISATSPITNGCDISIQRTYRVTDLCSSTSEVVQTISWTHDEIPEITRVEADRYYDCSDGIPTNLTPAFTDFEHSLRWPTEQSVATNIVTNGCLITLTRIYRIETCCGRFHEATARHTWTAPPAAPTIEGPMVLPLGCISSIGLIPVPHTSQFVVHDSCGGTIGYTGQSPTLTNGCEYSFTRTYVATNFCGLTSAFEQVVTYSLFSDPFAILAVEPPRDFGCSPTNPVPPANLDSIVLRGSAITQWVSEVIATNRGCEMRMVRTYFVEDCCGRIDDESVTFTWYQDGEAPTITTQENWQAIVNAGCNPTIGDIPPVDLTQFSLSDNCHATIWYAGDTTATNGCTASVTRVYTAGDDCGNEASITQQFIFLLDNIAPVPEIMPAEIYLGCNPTSIPDPDLSIFDVANTCGDVVGTAIVREVSQEVGCETWITRTYRVTDQCGNTGEADQILKYRVDNEAPVLLQRPDNTDFGCNESIPDPDPSQVTAFDECGGGVTVMLTNVTNWLAGCTETIQHAYSVMDDCSNAVATTVTYTRVVDTQPPALSCPTAIVVEADDKCHALMPQIESRADDTCGSVEVTQNIAPNTTLFGPSTNTATVTATDACGNISTCQVPIIVRGDCGPVDILKPAIHLDKSVYLGHDGGVNCGASLESVEGTNGQAVTYCFRIQNTGLVPLNAVMLTDSTVSAPLSQEVAMTLPVGAVTNFYIERTIEGDLVNVARVRGLPANGLPEVADVDMAEVIEVHPGIVISKTVSLDGLCPGGESLVGAMDQPITFCFDIYNTGDVRLVNVRLTDPQLGLDINLAGSLEPNQRIHYTAPSTITGPLINRAAVEGTPVNRLGEPLNPTLRITDSDTAEVDVGVARLEGVVWHDLNHNGVYILDGEADEVLENTGFEGITVQLYRVENESNVLVATTLTKPDGRYNFENLEPGDYTVTMEAAQIRFPFNTTHENNPPFPAYSVTLARGDESLHNDFGFNTEPTAVKLNGLVAIQVPEGVVIQWTTGSQRDLLGYRVSKNGEAVGDLISARGNSGEYLLIDERSTGGTYTLQAIGTDLATKTLGRTTTLADATPVGDPVKRIVAVDSRVEFITDDAASCMVLEFDTAPVIQDLTNDRILRGEVLQANGRFGVYFSAPPGLQIRIE